jgi:hypothetical protein
MYKPKKMHWWSEDGSMGSQSGEETSDVQVVNVSTKNKQPKKKAKVSFSNSAHHDIDINKMKPDCYLLLR